MGNSDQESRMTFNQYMRGISASGSSRIISSARELYSLTQDFSRQTTDSFDLELRFMSSWAALRSSFIVASHVVTAFGEVEIKGETYFDSEGLSDDQILAAESHALLLYGLGVFSEQDENTAFFQMPSDSDFGLPPLVAFDEDRTTALYYHDLLNKDGRLQEIMLE